MNETNIEQLSSIYKILHLSWSCFFKSEEKLTWEQLASHMEKKLNSGFCLRSWTDTVKKFNVKSN